MKQRSTVASGTFRALLGLALMAALPGFVHANAARVDFAVGSVRGIGADGQERRLVRGSRLRSGDTVVTRIGRAQLRFSDGSYTSLSPNTEFRIDDYAYEGEKDEGARSFFSLIKGGLRTITGAIGRIRRQAYKLTTPVATIGIRGTSLWAKFDPVRGLDFGVGDGGILVCSPRCKGFGSGESGRVTAEGEDPESTGSKGKGERDPNGDKKDSGQNTGYSRGNDVTEQGLSQVVVDAIGNSVGVGDGGDNGNGNGDIGGMEDGAPSLVPLPSGPFHVVSVVAAGSRGTDLQTRGRIGDEVDAQFRSDGALMDFVYTGSADGGDLEGFAADPVAGIEDFGQDGAGSYVGWGRWTSGELGPVGNTTNYEELHYAVGLPTVPAEVPTSATATYGLVGGTPPALVDPETGGVQLGQLDPSSHLMADFGNNTVTANVVTQITGETYTLNMGLDIGKDSGGSARPRNIFGGNNQAGVTSSGSCISGCSAYADGFFAGSGASHAGITYKFDPRRGAGSYVIGAAGFEAR